MRSPYYLNPSEFFNPGTLPMMDREWFPPEFFTGCDVQFVIAARDFQAGSDNSDVVDLSGYLEDDVVDFQFGVAQPKRPIYSYASYRFDRVALGQIIVQGEFSIPFTKKFRVLNAIAKAKRNQVGRAGNLLNAGADQKTEEMKNTWNGISLQDKIDLIKKGDLTGAMMDSLTSIGIAGARDVAAAIKNRSWGAYDRFGMGDDGLEIIINYSGSDPKARSAFDAIKGRSEETVDQQADRVISIHKVYLGSQTQVIRPKGSPVMEQYSFIAWDID